MQNNPLIYVDPSGHWKITVQEYDSGSRYIDIEYEGKFLETLGAIVNALPFGGTFDYYDKIQNLSGDLACLTDGKGGLVDYYIYKPDEKLYKRFKNWDTSVTTISDSLTSFGGYTDISKLFSSSIAKNIVKNAGSVVTAGLFFYDLQNTWNRVDKDEYIRAMIMEAKIDEYLKKINNPEDLFIIMTYIEEKLDSYGEEDYKTYNKYFGGYSGLNDFSDNHGISIWDKLFGNVDNIKKEKEIIRDYFEDLADKLSSDFRKDALNELRE